MSEHDTSAHQMQPLASPPPLQVFKDGLLQMQAMTAGQACGLNSFCGQMQEKPPETTKKTI